MALPQHISVSDATCDELMTLALLSPGWKSSSSWLDDVSPCHKLGARPPNQEYTGVWYLNDNCFQPPHLSTPDHSYAGIGEIWAVCDAHVTCNSDCGHSAKKSPHSLAVCLWAWFLPSCKPEAGSGVIHNKTLLKVHFFNLWCFQSYYHHEQMGFPQLLLNCR